MDNIYLYKALYTFTIGFIINLCIFNFKCIQKLEKWFRMNPPAPYECLNYMFIAVFSWKDIYVYFSTILNDNLTIAHGLNFCASAIVFLQKYDATK